MPLGQSRRVWWTTGPVPGTRHGGPVENPARGTRTPFALRAERARRCLQRNRTEAAIPASGARLSTNAGLDPLHSRALLLASSDAASHAGRPDRVAFPPIRAQSATAGDTAKVLVAGAEQGSGDDS